MKKISNNKSSTSAMKLQCTEYSQFYDVHKKFMKVHHCTQTFSNKTVPKNHELISVYALPF